VAYVVSRFGPMCRSRCAGSVGAAVHGDGAGRHPDWVSDERRAGRRSNQPLHVCSSSLASRSCALSARRRHGMIVGCSLGQSGPALPRPEPALDHPAPRRITFRGKTITLVGPTIVRRPGHRPTSGRPSVYIRMRAMYGPSEGRPFASDSIPPGQLSGKDDPAQRTRACLLALAKAGRGCPRGNPWNSAMPAWELPDGRRDRSVVLFL